MLVSKSNNELNSSHRSLLEQEWALHRGKPETYEKDWDEPALDPSIGKTGFWRNRYILDQLVPELVKQLNNTGIAQPQILELACSTGRETYSLASSCLNQECSFHIRAIDPDSPI